MDPATVGLIGILVTVGLILLGINIGMVMFAVGLFGFGYIVNMNAAIGLFKTIPFAQATSFSVAVIPLFVLMGQFAFKSGMSSGLYDFSRKWFSGLPGPLAVATVAAAAGFSSICGSTTATTATMTSLALPEMKEAKYDNGLACGSIVAGGTLGVLIPPSTIFIMYGIMAEQSIGRLFCAGILPGILLACLYIMTIVIVCKARPGFAPGREHFSWLERLSSLKHLISVGLLFIAVIGGMFSGFFTANEAAAIGAFIALVFIMIYRKMSLKTLLTSLKETVLTSGMIFQVMLGAMVYNSFLTVSNLPINVAKWIISMDMNRYLVIALIFLIFLILGCCIDSIAMVLLTVPIFLPIITELGFSPICYGVMMVLAAEQGLMTPPVGMNVFIVSNMAKDIPIQKIFKGTLPFVAAIFACIVILIAFPQIALLLPGIIFG